jgi:hypothetical protein
MNVVNTIENFNINNVYYSDSQENTVIENSIFIKLLYSTNHISLNGIFLLCNFNNFTIEKHYNKVSILWNQNHNSKLETELINIEKKVLDKYKTNKNPSYIISNFVKRKCIKIFSDNTEKDHFNSILLRISGIWENDREYGLAFKFLELNSI